jgi:excisionase family DNA binding protein
MVVEIREGTEYLTVAELAKVLRVGTATIYRMIESGGLRVIRPTPHTTRIPISEMHRLKETD